MQTTFGAQDRPETMMRLVPHECTSVNAISIGPDKARADSAAIVVSPTPVGTNGPPEGSDVIAFRSSGEVDEFVRALRNVQRHVWGR